MEGLRGVLLFVLLLFVLRFLTRPRRKLPHERLPRPFAPRWHHREPPGEPGPRRLSFRR
jgi:hypothetical protein